MSEILLLIKEFFITGLFSIGGGLATVPFLQDMAVKYGWFTVDQLSTMIAISESTPGPIGINMATYVGNIVAGIPGAIIATLSLVAADVIIIIIIANNFQKFKDSELVKKIFFGIKPAVVAFIIAACVSLFTDTLLNMEMVGSISMFRIKEIIFLIILFLIDWKKKDIHPILFIVFSAIIGMLFKF